MRKDQRTSCIFSVTRNISFQVRKSFFNELDINNNVSVVDLLYEQFYTGSADVPTEEQQEFMRNLFRSENYVKSEFR